MEMEYTDPRECLWRFGVADFRYTLSSDNEMLQVDAGHAIEFTNYITDQIASRSPPSGMSTARPTTHGDYALSIEIAQSCFEESKWKRRNKGKADEGKTPRRQK
jgi:hypothetical protein